jgi:uncharacterized protein (DUF952 family)
MTVVYKLLRPAEWQAFDTSGEFAGSPDDIRDGFIHLSAADQLARTRAKYFAAEDVVAVALDAAALGPALRWEVSRGGVEFPHLYRALVRADIVAVEPDLH